MGLRVSCVKRPFFSTNLASALSPGTHPLGTSARLKTPFHPGASWCQQRTQWGEGERRRRREAKREERPGHPSGTGQQTPPGAAPPKRVPFCWIRVIVLATLLSSTVRIYLRALLIINILIAKAPPARGALALLFVAGHQPSASTSTCRNWRAALSSTPLMYLCPSVAPNFFASDTASLITTL